MAGASILVKCGVESESRPAVFDDPAEVEMLWVNSSAFDDADIHLLRGYTGLWHLNLSRSNISSAAIKELDGRVLSCLRLRGTNVNDEGLRWLAGRFPRLQELDLGDTRVTDDGIHWLCGLPRLYQLYLDGTSVSDRTLQDLEKAPRDLMVFLPRTNVTKKGVEALRRVRPDIRVFLEDQTAVDVAKPMDGRGGKDDGD